MVQDTAALIRVIRTLSRLERLRLVEEIVRDLAEELQAQETPGAVMIGLFADEADAVEEMNREAKLF